MKESSLLWMRNLYGIFGKPRGTNKPPRFIGYVQATSASLALAQARKTKVAQKITFTEAKPYNKLGKFRKLQIGFGQYTKELRKGAI